MTRSPSWPVLLATALYLGILGTIVASDISRNDGQFVYPLDDTYIHMAMAKNIVEHGVWGVTQYEFTSSSSSPLWTLLIAGFFLVGGTQEWIPLLLSAIAGVGFIILCHGLLKELRINQAPTAGILAAIVLLMPLPVTAYTGLEHSFHAFLTLLFMAACARWLAGEDDSARTAIVPAIVAALLCATRYEGAFLVLLAVVAAGLVKRKIQGGLVALGGALPILLYGAYSASQGWYWLPTSVLLKGHRPDLSSLPGLLTSLLDKLFERVSTEPHILVLVLSVFIALAALIRHGESLRRFRPLLLLFLGGALVLHFQFAKIHWFYRYEAYLIGIWLLVMGVELLDSVYKGNLTDARKRLNRIAWVAVALASLSPLMLRAFVAYTESPQASANIYQQQIQMARFLGKNYPGDIVVLNDIGAVGFYTDVRVMDLMGLATLEAARIRYGGTYRTADLERLTLEKGATIGIVFDGFLADLGPSVPTGWVRAGEWTISNNVVCGEATVSFYAFTQEGAGRLLNALRSFAPEMPPGIVVKVLKK